MQKFLEEQIIKTKRSGSEFSAIVITRKMITSMFGKYVGVELQTIKPLRRDSTIKKKFRIGIF